MRSADRDSHDKNLVGSLDRLAIMASSHNSVNSILTLVYPYMVEGRKSEDKGQAMYEKLSVHAKRGDAGGKL